MILGQLRLARDGIINMCFHALNVFSISAANADGTLYRKARSNLLVGVACGLFV
jgi:hypothetical protein